MISFDGEVAVFKPFFSGFGKLGSYFVSFVTIGD